MKRLINYTDPEWVRVEIFIILMALFFVGFYWILKIAIDAERRN